jgi:S-adenosylmethionine synthetase
MSSTAGAPSRYVFTSESVTEGHPDKICDQVSDAVLDALLAQDPASRVACETVVNTGLCLITGEVTTTARVDFNTLVRGVIQQIGYSGARAGGFDSNSCAVLVALDQQSPDIAQGVDEADDHAGDPLDLVGAGADAAADQPGPPPGAPPGGSAPQRHPGLPAA